MKFKLGIMDQCDTKIDLIKYMSVSVRPTCIFRSLVILLNILDYLMEDCYVWDNGSM